MCQEGANDYVEPAATPCPKLFLVFDDSLEPPTFDLNLAKDFMRKAGFNIPKTEISVALGLTLPIFATLPGLIGGCLTLLSRRGK